MHQLSSRSRDTLHSKASSHRNTCSQCSSSRQFNHSIPYSHSSQNSSSRSNHRQYLHISQYSSSSSPHSNTVSNHSSKCHRAPIHHHSCVSCHHPLQCQTLDAKAAHHSPAHQQDSPSHHQRIHPQLTASTSAFQTHHRISALVPSTRLSSSQSKTHQTPNQTNCVFSV